MTAVIELPALPPPVDQLWHTLLDLGDQLEVPWALIGGQMVLLHAIEHGQVPPLISQDGDVIADIRAVPGALTHVVARLEHRGFAPQSISADGLAHRYTRTAEVPGGTQALSRTELITVVHEGRRGTIPRPTLLAAIVGKAAATVLPSPERHYRDLALLCALVRDPFELVDQLTHKDRQRLRLARKLLDDSHPAWPLLPTAIRSAGQIAYGVLHG